MCGMAGLVIAPSAAGPEDPAAVVVRMADALRHRGPDGAGAWHDREAGVHLAHRRLAVLDLSPTGAQPMASASGRSVVVLNGEIYDHLELRARLVAEGGAPAWRGRSDTETLVEAIERWGIAATLARCSGMFALAVWDRRERVLHLARDRFGEKPLYYGWVGEGVGRAFAFGSELKALRAVPGFANPVCREALADYLRLAFVPAPRSILRGIHKLEPGCRLALHGEGFERPPAPVLSAPLRAPGFDLHRWWSLAEVVERGAASAFTDEREALEALEQALGAAVAAQSQADVPVGAFLSGGIDSSTVVALLQQRSPRPAVTFTVAFDDPAYDESTQARAVASRLGSEHHELRVTAAEARATIPALPAMYDEPFGDSSQVPTHLVCRAARAQVTVALSGDGGDELFGGYNRYRWAPRIWARARHLPGPLRRGAVGALLALAPRTWDRLLAPAGVAQAGAKLHKLADALDGAHSLEDLYRNLSCAWPAAAAPVVGGPERGPLALAPLPTQGAADPRAAMMYRDALGYLPDDLLCKVDRAAMAIGLETRAPFLDHRVAELAWRLPMALKAGGGPGKRALRLLLARHLPAALFERPKAGFAMPVGEWLRGPLRDWAEDLLAADRLRREAFLDPVPVRAAWDAHRDGRRDRGARLWTVLMFQAWLAAYGDHP